MADVTMWTGADVKTLRDACRLTQSELAELLRCAQRTVSFWESRPYRRVSISHQARLDRVLKDADHGAHRRFRALIGELDVNRRDFIAATGAVIGTATTNNSGSPTVTSDAIGHLRDTVHSAQLLDDQLGSDAARPIVEAQARTCAALLRDCPASLRPALHSLTGEAMASSAWSAWDQGDLNRAETLFRTAHEHAEESGDIDIATGILCHRTQLAVQLRDFRDAATIADGMLRLPVRDRRVDDFRKLCAAQAFASDGRKVDAWRQLIQVSDEFTEQTTPDESYCYYQSAWTTSAMTARCLETCGEPDAAADTIEAALGLIPRHATRDRALWNLSLAQLTVTRDIDRAGEAARRALALAARNTSPRLRQAYAQTRTSFEPWATAQPVRDLDAYAATVLA
ncbi:helix-turn-helix domain-containing protein [Nocardia asiatica]|uniref:helix-turn-helix domain-containing protein n=1 Tax=Nocardia asiatica TaxID=209252 RepID=UPI00245670A4|nr:helix-turn-helix transcriptional regulator [Nocardia asiatica]